MMFAAIIFMLCGFGVGVYGLVTESSYTAMAGLVVIGTVCVIWWFWVMFIIRSMIANADRTIENVASIRADLKEIKSLVEQDFFERQR